MKSDLSNKEVFGVLNYFSKLDVERLKTGVEQFAYYRQYLFDGNYEEELSIDFLIETIDGMIDTGENYFNNKGKEIVEIAERDINKIKGN